MRIDIEGMISRAIARAKAKHPGGLGDHPMAVLMEEVGEVSRAYLDAQPEREAEELLDTIAVCVRRLEEIA